MTTLPPAPLRTADPWHLVIPGSIHQRTGGYLYDAHMMRELREQGREIQLHQLPGRFPAGDPVARAALSSVLGTLPRGSRVLVDGLALGGLPREAALHGERVRMVALVHHPLADESGLPGHLRVRLHATEREALRCCRGVVVTSPFTGERVRTLGVPPERIQVAPPGTAPAPPAPAPSQAPAFGGEEHAPPHLLCVGSLAPRKGQDVLVEAMAALRDYDWILTMAGSLSRNPSFARMLAERIREIGLGKRIRMAGEVDDAVLEDLYRQSSLLVVPSRYEGYGMVVSEALVRGIPVVATDGGALTHTVPSGAGVLVPAGDPQALGSALRGLLESRRSRRDEAGSAPWRRIVSEARRQGRQLPDWPQAAVTLAGAMESLAELPLGTFHHRPPTAPE